MRQRPPRSLKARALQLLAQREQSRVELRRKLLAQLRRDEAGPAAAGPVVADSVDDADDDAENVDTGETADAGSEVSQVEAVLDGLAAHGYASDERFAESRVHARSARYGNLRIRQELKQHAVTLPIEAQQALAASEEARAATVYQRRFDDRPPATPAEAAKRARFLAARGFTPEVIRRVLKAGAGRPPR